MQVRETVRDVKFLHNEQYFAAAQRKYVYIYDKRGLEVHCLKVRQGRVLGHSALVPNLRMLRCTDSCASARLPAMQFHGSCVSLQEHTGVRRLEFLPYHFLLTSIGEGGVLRYQARARQGIACLHAALCTVG